jgi:hypothetical protein
MGPENVTGKDVGGICADANREVAASNASTTANRENLRSRNLHCEQRL